MGAIRRWFESS